MKTVGMNLKQRTIPFLDVSANEGESGWESEEFGVGSLEKIRINTVQKIS